MLEGPATIRQVVMSKRKKPAPPSFSPDRVEFYQRFGRRVRKSRIALMMTQLELAEKVDLSRGSVANIEAGRQQVLIHQVLDLAQALRCKPYQLLGLRVP